MHRGVANAEVIQDRTDRSPLGPNGMEIWLERVMLAPDLAVGVVARTATLTHRLARLLSGSGSVETLPSEEAALQLLREVPVVVVAEPDLSAPQALEIDPCRWGSQFGRSVVVCTVPNVSNLAALIPFPSLRVVPLGISDGPLLNGTVRACLRDCAFGRVQALLRSRRFNPPLLHQALLRVFTQVPLPPEDAVEASASGKAPFLRTVKSLAEALGCSPGYLMRIGREYGLSVSEAVRWGTFFRGMVVRRLSGRPWSELAFMLGFTDSSAWANFVRRLVGMTPSEAERVSLRVWESRVLQAITPSPTSGKNWACPDSPSSAFSEGGRRSG